MTHQEKLAELQNELARQDHELEAAREQLRSLGNVALEIPQRFFDELDELTSVERTVTNIPTNAIRV